MPARIATMLTRTVDRIDTEKIRLRAGDFPQNPLPDRTRPIFPIVLVVVLVLDL
jgi:hypothetical protein